MTGDTLETKMFISQIFKILNRNVRPCETISKQVESLNINRKLQILVREREREREMFSPKEARISNPRETKIKYGIIHILILGDMVIF